jgi:hypothetical protein
VRSYCLVHRPAPPRLTPTVDPRRSSSGERRAAPQHPRRRASERAVPGLLRRDARHRRLRYLRQHRRRLVPSLLPLGRELGPVRAFTSNVREIFARQAPSPATGADFSRRLDALAVETEEKRRDRRPHGARRRRFSSDFDEDAPKPRYQSQWRRLNAT